MWISPQTTQGKRECREHSRNVHAPDLIPKPRLNTIPECDDLFSTIGKGQTVTICAKDVSVGPEMQDDLLNPAPYAKKT